MTMQLPAYLQNRASTLGADLASGLGGGRQPRLSIERQSFTAIDANGNEKPVAQFDAARQQLYVDVIIVDGNRALSKQYYADAYDPQAAEFVPPTCWSDNGVGPSAQAQAPQAATCAACPHNVWGSAITQQGKQTRACRDSKKVAVIIPALSLDMVFLFRIPPASMNKHFAPYLRMIAAQNGGTRPLDPADIVTRITFDRETQGVLNFEAVGFISEPQFHAVAKAQADSKTAELVGKTDVVHTGVALPPPAAAPALPPVQAAPAFGAAPQPAAPMFAQPQNSPVNMAPTPTPPAFGAPPAGQPMFGATEQLAEAPKRRGRKPQAAAPQPPVQTAPVAPMQDPNPPPAGTPAFLLNNAQPGPAPSPAPTAGFVQAPPPPSDVQAALLAALGQTNGSPGSSQA